MAVTPCKTARDPSPSAAPALRFARAGAFAVVCLGLGILAHVLGGGSVSSRAVMSGLAFAMLAGLASTGRERGTGAILLLLAGMQVALHMLFCGMPVGAPPAGAGGSDHAGLGLGFGMLMMHGWAVVLTALWLSRGEAALWAMLRRFTARFRLLLAVSATVCGVRRAYNAGGSAREVLRSAWLRYAVCGRAPPSSAVFA